MVPIAGVEPAEPDLSSQYVYQFHHMGYVWCSWEDSNLQAQRSERCRYSNSLHRSMFSLGVQLFFSPGVYDRPPLVTKGIGND